MGAQRADSPGPPDVAWIVAGLARRVEGRPWGYSSPGQGPDDLGGQSVLVVDPSPRTLGDDGDDSADSWPWAEWLLGPGDPAARQARISASPICDGVRRLDAGHRCLLLAPTLALGTPQDDAATRFPPGEVHEQGCPVDVLTAILATKRSEVCIMCDWHVSGPTGELPAVLRADRARALGRLLGKAALALPPGLVTALSNTTLHVCLGADTPTDECRSAASAFAAALRGDLPRARIWRGAMRFQSSQQGAGAPGGPPAGAGAPAPETTAGLTPFHTTERRTDRGAASFYIGTPRGDLGTASGNRPHEAPPPPDGPGRLADRYDLDHDAQEIVDDLAGDGHDPVLGAGRVDVDDAGGRVTMACAASTVAQLLLAADADRGHVAHCTVDIAKQTRRWVGIDANAVLPIADAWAVAVALLRPTGPVPRLALLRTARAGGRRQVCEGRHLSVIAAPRAWDGTYAVAVGTGAHFDPIFWRRLLHIDHIAPGGRHRCIAPASLTTDMGPGALMLVSLGAEMAGRCPRSAASPGAARPLSHPLDFDAGVISAALRIAADSAGACASLLRTRAERRAVDGVLVCQQADGGPQDPGAETDTNITRLLQHAMWAPAPGATYLVVAAADNLSWVVGVVGANSAAANRIRGWAPSSTGAAGPVTL